MHRLIIINDRKVKESRTKHAETVACYRKPVSAAEALAWLQSHDRFDTRDILPSGTVRGPVRHGRRRDVTQVYGFVPSPFGDVFVNSLLMETVADGDDVCVKVGEDAHGYSASAIACYSDYIRWHEEELVAVVTKRLTGEYEEWLDHHEHDDPGLDWDTKKAACAKLGLSLISLSHLIDDAGYGGRGTDTYLFKEAVSGEQAGQVLDALNARHEEPAAGPTLAGKGRVTLIENGFEYSWVGAWND